MCGVSVCVCLCVCEALRGPTGGWRWCGVDVCGVRVLVCVRPLGPTAPHLEHDGGQRCLIVAVLVGLGLCLLHPVLPVGLQGLPQPGNDVGLSRREDRAGRGVDAPSRGSSFRAACPPPLSLGPKGSGGALPRPPARPSCSQLSTGGGQAPCASRQLVSAQGTGRSILQRSRFRPVQKGPPSLRPSPMWDQP